jgi:magnesium chelatase subunit H
LYAVNNPSESILAKRRGYGTLVSYNVPPYGRAGLYLELANLKEIVDEYRTMDGGSDLKEAIVGSVQRCGMMSDVPLLDSEGNAVDMTTASSVSPEAFDNWILSLSNYLVELQNRLFSSGLHALGTQPTSDEIKAYLNAYYGNQLSEDDLNTVLETYNKEKENDWQTDIVEWARSFLRLFQGDVPSNNMHGTAHHPSSGVTAASASHVASLLKRSTEELDAIMNALDGGYVAANPGGDLLRDGESVLPTGA